MNQTYKDIEELKESIKKVREDTMELFSEKERLKIQCNF